MSKLPERQRDSLPAGYTEFLEQVNARIVAARTRAVLAVYTDLLDAEVPDEERD
jgi:hypothetical protein